ncbi:MFS transporter [Brachybacterium saurashtrense]|uniref:MFS transporter n=1 Tax=Brachybacterium saurashtrense TaxID=556288 RepID=A0A345YL70_9MICO|nr:MFS transporter [Brachybacterium saurashtrense]AXK44672.1 MFS transporter [Brachybacterium saurashtrense]RRR23284.1 MFS transporter [Brachybacterium saurashtrense]
MSGARGPDEAPEAAAPPLRRNLEYLKWLLGDLLADMGTGIGTFAFPLVTFMVTDSLGVTGMVALVQGVGALVGLVPGGLLADRHERRRLRLLAGLTGAAVQAVLVAVLLTGTAGAVVLALLAFADRLRHTLLGGASNAMLKQLVPPAQLPRAVAVNQGREAAVEMGSGPAGGALLGLSIAFPPLAQLLGNLGTVAATLAMRGRYLPRAEGAARTRVRDDLREALRWCVSQPIRLQMLAISCAVNLGANGLLFTVLLDLADAGVPATRIGLLNTVLAAAILLGAVLAPRLVDTVPTGALAIAPVLLMAAVGVFLPFAPGLVWIGAAYAVLGIGLPAINAASQGFFTHITPVPMQGRVSSLMRLVSSALMPLAPAAAGWGLQLVGALATLLGFTAVLIAGAAVGLLGPDLRRVPTAPQWERYAREEGLAAEEE